MGQPTLDYLRKRGISDEVLKKFQIGYCPEEVHHDLAGRVLMPLHDAYGNEVVAFTTRDFNAPKEFQHWHEQFEKSRYLYGFHLAKDAIRKHDKAIVVEGQFDTMCLHSFGFNMTVGLCGHSMSIMHVTLLVRYCSEIYLMLDPDAAGNGSIERAMKLYRDNSLKNCGILFIPVYLPAKCDPDEYVMKYGTQELLKLLKESKEKAING